MGTVSSGYLNEVVLMSTHNVCFEQTSDIASRHINGMALCSVRTSSAGGL